MTSTPAPPSYNAVVHARANECLPTLELLSLQLVGDSVVARESNSILYKLSQDPLSGIGSVLGVEEILYRPSPPNSEEPHVKTRTRHLYDVKPFKWHNIAVVERRLQGMYDLEAQSGPTHCFTHGAHLEKGRWFPYFERMGSTWRVSAAEKSSVVTLRGKKVSDTVRWWRDEEGNIIAVESLVDGSFLLELKTHLDKRRLNLLVTSWCAIIWQVYCERHELEVLKAQKKFSK